VSADAVGDRPTGGSARGGVHARRPLYVFDTLRERASVARNCFPWRYDFLAPLCCCANFWRGMRLTTPPTLAPRGHRLLTSGAAWRRGSRTARATSASARYATLTACWITPTATSTVLRTGHTTLSPIPVQANRRTAALREGPQSITSMRNPASRHEPGYLRRSVEPDRRTAQSVAQKNPDTSRRHSLVVHLGKPAKSSMP